MLHHITIHMENCYETPNGAIYTFKLIEINDNTFMVISYSLMPYVGEPHLFFYDNIDDAKMLINRMVEKTNLTKL